MTDPAAEPTRSLFEELLAALKDLVRAIPEVELQMRALSLEFSARFKKSPLVLYEKKEWPRRGQGAAAEDNPRYTGRPRALYWGRACRTGIVFHLKGYLNGGMIAKIALQSQEKEAFYDFERRRLHINRLRSWLVAARTGIRKVVAPFAAKADVAMTNFTPNLHPLTASHLPTVTGLWALARAIDSMGGRMADLAERSAREVLSQHPAAAGGSAPLEVGAAAARSAPLGVGAAPARPAVRFIVHTVDSARGNARIYVTIARTRIPVEQLTREMLHEAKIPPHVEEIYIRYRGEAKALNAQASRLRASLAHVRRLLERDPAEFTMRRRPPRRQSNAMAGVYGRRG